MKVETRFSLTTDGLIGVEALIAGPTGRISATLVFDTGAVMTTVVPHIAESIGYSPALRTRPIVTRTAAAEERGYGVMSDVTALGFRHPNLEIVVADLGYGVQGLLGIDFLRHLIIELRYTERRIIVDRALT